MPQIPKLFSIRPQSRRKQNTNQSCFSTVVGYQYAAPTTPTKPAATAAAPTADNDIIAHILGDFGIWQLRTVLIIFLCKIPAAWFMACIIFTAPELYAGVEFECIDGTTIQTSAAATISRRDQCSYMLQSNNESVSATVMSAAAAVTRKCHNYRYHSKFQSLIMQFDLVCERDILIAWTQYWHLFGVLVGGVVATKMMLRFSPRTVYALGMLAQIACGCVTGFARDFSLHCAFRCLSAVCCALMFTAGQAIFADIIAGKYRTGVIILYDTFWSIGVILLPGLCSFFRHWTHIYLGITFPTLLLLLLLQWTPESPRWLLRNGDSQNVQRVAQIIRNAAVINGNSMRVPNDIVQQLDSLRDALRSKPPSATWMDLWRRGGQRAKLHMIGAHLALAAYIINFMGMLLNIRSFGRDYLVPNTIAMGFSEIVGCFLAFHFALKHGAWKWQWAGGFNIIAGLIGCLGWIFSGVENMDANVKVTLWMIIATIPKAGVSLAQSMLLACMGELMPDANQRPLFIFSVVTWARVWLLSAPFINVLKRIDVALSLSAYCCLSIFGGICTCLLVTPRVVPVDATKLPQFTAKQPKSDLTAQDVWTVEQNEVYITRL